MFRFYDARYCHNNICLIKRNAKNLNLLFKFLWDNH